MNGEHDLHLNGEGSPRFTNLSVLLREECKHLLANYSGDFLNFISLLSETFGANMESDLFCEMVDEFIEKWLNELLHKKDKEIGEKSEK